MCNCIQKLAEPIAGMNVKRFRIPSIVKKNRLPSNTYPDVKLPC